VAAGSRKQSASKQNSAALLHFSEELVQWMTAGVQDQVRKNPSLSGR
jgi:hypothetical protein